MAARLSHREVERAIDDNDVLLHCAHRAPLRCSRDRWPGLNCLPAWSLRVLVRLSTAFSTSLLLVNGTPGAHSAPCVNSTHRYQEIARKASSVASELACCDVWPMRMAIPMNLTQQSQHAWHDGSSITPGTLPPMYTSLLCRLHSRTMGSSA